jgi:hypothetical protein
LNSSRAAATATSALIRADNKTEKNQQLVQRSGGVFELDTGLFGIRGAVALDERTGNVLFGHPRAAIRARGQAPDR